MPFLNEIGFYAYLRCTEVEYFVGLLGPAEYRLRLSYLRTLLDPQRARQMLLWSDEDEPPPTDSPDSDIKSKTLGDGDFLLNDSEHQPGPPTPPQSSRDSAILRLITAQAGALGEKWLFNNYDDDFFPSVPHGHLVTRGPVKLDAYRGYTFDTARNNKELKRESRDFMASLWNDQKFRLLAARAISYFVDTHPRFDWYGQRGIRNPFVLPRFR